MIESLARVVLENTIQSLPCINDQLMNWPDIIPFMFEMLLGEAV